MPQIDIINFLAIEFLERLGIPRPTQQQIDRVEVLTRQLIHQSTLGGLIRG